MMSDRLGSHVTLFVSPRDSKLDLGWDAKYELA